MASVWRLCDGRTSEDILRTNVIGSEVRKVREAGTLPDSRIDGDAGE
jgi:hypothetical protein